jgi:hypothetical protein
LKATKEKLTKTTELSEEDSTMSRCRSDSLAVISYRDINVFTYYVNTPDVCLRRYLSTTYDYEDADLKKHQCKTSKYTCSLMPPYLPPCAGFCFLKFCVNGRLGDACREAPPLKDCRSSGGSACSSRLPPPPKRGTSPALPERARRPHHGLARGRTRPSPCSARARPPAVYMY